MQHMIPRWPKLAHIWLVMITSKNRQLWDRSRGGLLVLVESWAPPLAMSCMRPKVCQLSWRSVDVNGERSSAT